ALIQLNSVSVAKATFRHFTEDEEPRVGIRRVYVNYSRSQSMEIREGSDSNGTDFTRGDNNVAVGATPAIQDTSNRYAHLILEDHSKLVGLATAYLQKYGITGGEGAILNIHQREEMSEYLRHSNSSSAAV
ncbi:unnamed protein product, partial [Choristocarpus tenellus]